MSDCRWHRAGNMPNIKMHRLPMVAVKECGPRFTGLTPEGQPMHSAEQHLECHLGLRARPRTRLQQVVPNRRTTQDRK